MKQYGLIGNSTRGVWSIAPDKRDIETVDPKDVKRVVREAYYAKRDAKATLAGETPEEATEDSPEVKEIPEDEDAPEEAQSWREVLHRVLTHDLTPDAFERLTQRLLRESGFVHVEVTGKSGDGGIDGKGIARLSGMLSFHVIFQCKRYKGSVGASEIRDFRGTMVGRADKGLFITTGTFMPTERPRHV